MALKANTYKYDLLFIDCIFNLKVSRGKNLYLFTEVGKLIS